MKLDKKFLLGLYLYLRQRHLSIDRTPCQDWRQLVDFFSDKTPIEKVMQKLEDTAPIVVKCSDLENVIKPPIKRSVVGKLMRKHYCLSQDEFIYIYKQLSRLNRTLTQGYAITAEEKGLLRVNLSHCDQIVHSRLKNKDYNEEFIVEHFNQNPILTCKPLEEILGGPWL